jgi:hypothetical protein
MTAEGEIRQTVDLPFGYRATFRWSRAMGSGVEWEPDVPRNIRSPRARRKLFEAYSAARRSFNQDVATTIGGAILIVDLDGAMEVVRPAAKH